MRWKRTQTTVVARYSLKPGPRNGGSDHTANAKVKTSGHPPNTPVRDFTTALSKLISIRLIASSKPRCGGLPRTIVQTSQSEFRACLAPQPTHATLSQACRKLLNSVPFRDEDHDSNARPTETPISQPEPQAIGPSVRLFYSSSGCVRRSIRIRDCAWYRLSRPYGRPTKSDLCSRAL